MQYAAYFDAINSIIIPPPVVDFTWHAASPNSITLSKATKFQRHLKSGLLYLEQRKENFNLIFEDVEKNREETTDDFLLRKAIELKNEKMIIYLASNDQHLRKRAKEATIGVIFLRQKKYLSIERS